MKKRCLSVLLALCMALTMAPAVAFAEEKTDPAIPADAIYVSQEGDTDGDGTSAGSALSFDTAMASAKDGDVFAVVGTVEMENWTTPEANITIQGADENAVLKFAGYGSTTEVWLSLQGDLTVKDLTLGFSKQQYTVPENGGPSLPAFIFANGHTLHLTETAVIDTPEWKESPKSSSSRMVKSPVYIFGGGDRENNVTGDTHLVLEMKLKNEESFIYAYGGGRCSDVSGNTNVKLMGENVHVRSIVGGGLVDQDEGTADVGGNTNITISGGAWAGDTKVSSTDPDTVAVAGGGHILSNDPSVIGTNSDIQTATANVAGAVNIVLNDITGEQVDCIVGGCYDAGRSRAAMITGTTGPVKIDIDDCQFQNVWHRIFGGGYISYGSENRMIQVNGDVTIAANNSLVQFVYGGGNSESGSVLSLVTGNVDMTLTNCTGGNANGVYLRRGIFVSGWDRTSSGPNMILGDATLTLKNVHAPNIHATGDGAGVKGKVVIDVYGGGSTDTIDERIYNSYQDNTTVGRHPNATLNIYGEVPLTSIGSMTQVNITSGSTLKQHREETMLFGRWGSELTNNVSLAPDARLELYEGTSRQENFITYVTCNQIDGNFEALGTLYIRDDTQKKTGYMIVGGTVTTGENSVFETDAPRENRDFIHSKTQHEAGAAKFDFPQGESVQPVLSAVDAAAVFPSLQGYEHRWYLDAKPFILKPVELTKYIADGDHNHDDPTEPSNCFPDPRFEGLSDDAEIRVGGQLWNKAEHNGQYPFVINYYEENGALLADDHKPGTYVAKVEPSDGIKLDNITINGSRLKTEDSLLHIRGISDAASMEDIDHLASKVVAKAPSQKVTESTAVIPESTGYLVNNIAGQQLNPGADIRLLHDELLSAGNGEDTFMKALQQRLEGTLEGAAESDIKVEADPNRQYAMKYLDLIDANDSNLLVCAQSEYSIYLPYPAGTDQNTEFALYRFDSLNRTYTEADSGDSAMENIKKTAIQEIAVTNETAGIKFTVPTDFANEDNYSIGALALTWVEKSSGGGGTTTRYTLHYESNGGTEYDSERYTRNTEVRLEKVPVREGYTFTGWYADKDLTEKISTIKMTSNKTVYAGWEATGVPDWLNGADHFAYIIGDDEGYVRPLANVTRAETAAIFFRLLKEDVREEYLTDRSGFADVEQGAWYNKAVSTMAALGVVKGYTEDTFAPHEAITRAEFAAICARFDTGTSDGESSFTDISGHWAESEIRRAAQLGWIQGDPDGRFRPNAPITRAEAMTIINRVLNRLPEEKEDLLAGMKEWPDALPGAWYYLAVQEATNSHAYEGKGEVYERWTALNVNPDWTEYQ